MKRKSINWADVWKEEMDAERHPEVPPEGFFTTEQWAEKIGKSPSSANRMIRMALKATPPRMRVVEVRILTSGRGLYRVPHYGFVNTESGNSRNRKPTAAPPPSS